MHGNHIYPFLCPCLAPKDLYQIVREGNRQHNIHQISVVTGSRRVYT